MRSDFHSMIATAFIPEEDLAEASDFLAESSHRSLRAVDHVEDGEEEKQRLCSLRRRGNAMNVLQRD